MDINKAKNIAGASTNAIAWTIGGVIRTAVKVVSTILLIILTTGLLFTCVFAYYVKTSLSTELELRLEDFQSSVALTSSIVYRDERGVEHTLQELYSEKNTVWVDYKNIPQYMEYAAIAIEDKRFQEHKGVDWYRTVGAFSNMFLSMRNDFGGSTLTQQLIKNLTMEDDITVQRKLLEIFRALEFETKYTKEEIMEWYLNSIFLGNRCWGVGTAAQTYFGKDVWDLTLAECASIIGITNNPSKYDPFVNREKNKERQELILHEMYTQGYISYSAYSEAVAQKLVFQQEENEEYVEVIRTWYEDNIILDVIADLKQKKGYSDNVARTLVYSGGYKIYSCYDPAIQAIVDEVYQNQENIPQPWGEHAQPIQSAIVIMDPYTGDVVAMSGGVGDKSGNFMHDRATIAKRPPGSSIKPIAVYAPALDLGLITQGTLVNDAPKGIINLQGTTWYPSNSGGGNRGVVTIREAVQRSLNTVAAQTVDVLTINESYRYMTTKLGVKSLDPVNDVAYAPLSLGQLTNGITVKEMAQAYSALANSGIFREARFYSSVYDSNGNLVLDNTSEPSIAFQENTAWNMTDMLVNAVSAGTGTEARLSNMPVAGKTGTTTDNWDRYFVGYTPYYVAAVWTGYDMPSYMNYGNSNPAAVIWQKIMSRVHESLEYKAFPAPSIGKPTNVFGNLKEEPEETEEPSEEPSPSPSESPSPSPSATATATPSPTPTSTATPTPTPSSPVTPSPTPTSPVTPSPTPSSFETPSPTPSPPVTPIATPPVTPVATPPTDPDPAPPPSVFQVSGSG